MSTDGPNGKAPNGRPLSYTPYQSHRRTGSSVRSSNSSSAASSLQHVQVTLPAAGTASEPSSATTQHHLAAAPSPTSPSSAASASASTSRSESPNATPVPVPVRSITASNDRSYRLNQRNGDDDLDAPPPLRRLKPQPSPSTSSSSRHNGGKPTSLGAQATAVTRSFQGPASSSKATGSQTRLPTSAAQPLSPNSHDRRNGSSSTPQVTPTPIQHSAANPPPQPPRPNGSDHRVPSSPLTPNAANLPGYGIGSAKTMSTSQALRLKQLQEQQQLQRRRNGEAAAAHIGTPSASTSAQSSRTHSPGPSFAAGTELAGFDALYAQQQQQQQMQMQMQASSFNPSATFQPRGVSRSLLADFVDIRRRSKGKHRAQTGNVQSREDTNRHEERIRRRVEKLLAIHDPATPLSEMSVPATESRTSFGSSVLSSLAPHSRFLTTMRTTSQHRALEQALVPWQPDDTVPSCPICSKAFGMGRRKHHCRACGRVVCASPEAAAAAAGEKAPAKCSAVVIQDIRALAAAKAAGGTSATTIAIRDLPSEAGFEALLNADGSTAPSPKPNVANPLEMPQRGFRLCRDCKDIVLRSQYMSEEGEIPEYVQLYDHLMKLQREIEQTLPEFQELVMGLQKQDPSSALGLASTSSKEKATLLQLQRDAASARKQLLSNFANYDALARKIKSLPDGGNVSLAKVKEAVERRAGAFLQANMFPLQSLPRFDSAGRHKRNASTASTASHAPSPSPSAASAPISGHASGGPNPQLIAVLQEQRDQIATFLVRAQQERKLNDVVLLKRNLEELDAEMRRMQVGGGPG